MILSPYYLYNFHILWRRNVFPLIPYIILAILITFLVHGRYSVKKSNSSQDSLFLLMDLFCCSVISKNMQSMTKKQWKMMFFQLPIGSSRLQVNCAHDYAVPVFKGTNLYHLYTSQLFTFMMRNQSPPVVNQENLSCLYIDSRYRKSLFCI